jgi:hypothetical protein
MGTMMVNPPNDPSNWKSTNVCGAIAFCLDKENSTKSIRIYSPPVNILLKKKIF